MMPKTSFRFQEDEGVRLRRDLLDADGTVLLPKGTFRHVLAVREDGYYAVRTDPVYDGATTWVPEHFLVEEKAPRKQTAVVLGERVYGEVSRIAFKEGQLLVALVALKGRHELFVVLAQEGLQGEYFLRATQAGDKVCFVIREEDPLQPRAHLFENLTLDANT